METSVSKEPRLKALADIANLKKVRQAKFTQEAPRAEKSREDYGRTLRIEKAIWRR